MKSFIKKILWSFGLLLLVAAGTVLAFAPFYKRTVYSVTSTVLLALILYICLQKTLIWKGRNK